MSHTPRGPRRAGRSVRPGTSRLVPGRSAVGTAGAAPPLSPRARALLWSLCCALLAVLTWQVLADGPLRSADERLGDALRAAAPPRADAELLADLGNPPVAVPVLCAAAVYALVRSRGGSWRSVVCAAVALAAVAPVVSVLKSWTHRPGPLGGTGYFPSGHAATTAVAFGAAFLLLRPLLPGRHGTDTGAGRPLGVLRVLRVLRPSLLWLVVLLVVGNGLGLVWRGYHWPADVLAAWCLAVPLLSAAALTARRWTARHRTGPPHGPSGPPADSGSGSASRPLPEHGSAPDPDPSSGSDFGRGPEPGSGPESGPGPGPDAR